MATRLLVVTAVAALIPLTACDVSQKPETFTLRVGPASVMLEPYQNFAVPAEPGVKVPSPVDTQGGAAPGVLSGDRSIRLYGPGVSRKRQTRV